VCGRFNVASTPGLQALLNSLGSDLQLPAPRYNVAPTETVPLLRADADGVHTLDDARWWLTPHWAPAVEQKYAMFNARCERLNQSPAFRDPFRRQRGVVPMSSFIEWRAANAAKQPWLISNDAQALAVAALWDVWRGAGGELLSCTLVTTGAAPSFAPWHQRMPVLLTAAELHRWLDNRTPVDANDPLFAPRLKTALTLAPLQRAVGNARAKDPALMAPVAEVVRLPADPDG
jgi:putative SOS response-associated peptidase YedK